MNLITLCLDLEAQKTAEQSVNLHLMRCLSDSLSDNCVDFRPEQYCSKVKRFMTKCPDVKPIRHKTIALSSSISISGGLA